MKQIIKNGALIVAIAFSANSHAGFNGVTVHSRANCGGFNESVTWYSLHSYNWRVESHHFVNAQQSRPAHILNTGAVFTWRAWVGHITEAYSTQGDKWYVQGFHFIYPNGREKIDAITQAKDCDIYDGWFDTNFKLHGVK